MGFEDNIGKWTVSELVRFLQEQLRQNPPESAPNLTSDTFTCTALINVLDQIQFNQVQTTVGAAGSASALPANPDGYIKILDYTGAVKVIPYYKPS